jgi:hypothetical protein
VSLISLRVSLRLDCDSNNVSDVPTTRQVSKNITSDCLVERDHGSDVSPHPSDTEATNQSEVNHNIVTSKHTLRGSAVPWLIIYLAILSSTFWPVETYNQIHQIMAILIQPTKKRNRPTSQAAHESSSRMSTTNKPSSPPPDDEYEHAVAFLRDFHSRRVALYSWSDVDPSPPSSSVSATKHNAASVHHHHICGGGPTVCCYDKLAPIKEEEPRCSTTNTSSSPSTSTMNSTKVATAVSLDDMLSNDFALALTVDNTTTNNNNKMWNSSAPDITPSSLSISNSFYSTSSTCSPRMKKAMTTKCLLDLGRKSSSTATVAAAREETKKQDHQELENNNAFSSVSSTESVGNNINRNNGCSEEEEVESVTSSSDCVSSCSSSSSSSSRRSSESSLVVDDGYFIRDLPSSSPSTNSSKRCVRIMQYS